MSRDLPRAAETRERTTREALGRPTAAAYRPPAKLPLPEHRDGVEYRWCRTEDDGGPSWRRLSEGWEPVSANEEPSLALYGMDKTAPLRRGRLMLMKIPVASSLARQAYYAEKAQAQRRANEVMEGRSVVPGTPLPTYESHHTQTIVGGRVVSDVRT